MSNLLRLKLANKAYNAAYLYYKIRSYKAAATAFKALLLLNTPDTPKREEAMFYIVKSYYLLAQKAAFSHKQRERYRLGQNYIELFEISR